MELKELEQKYVELGVEIQRLKAQQEKIGYKDDPIFLLSVEEYEKYGNEIPELRWWWWLRSTGCTHSHSAAVNAFGKVFYTGHYVYNDFGNVRPALNLKSYPMHYNIVSTIERNGVEKITTCGATWVKIADDIYIAENPIGFDKFDDESNDYESSYIRKWLLNWFKERKNWL